MDSRSAQDRRDPRQEPASKTATTVEFAFGAVFTSLKTVPLPADDEEDLSVVDLLATTTGRLWVVDAYGSAVKVYSQDGQRLKTLERETTELRRPVSLASLYGRWIAALDGHLPAISILDEVGRPLRRFKLPELDRPRQVCNLGDRRLAVLGSGWGRGSGNLVHLYTPAGEYIESLYGEPLGSHAAGRLYAAAAGDTLYLAHSRTDSFVIYDLESSSVVAFPKLDSVYDAASSSGNGQDASRPKRKLKGLFATACGPLVVLYSEGPQRTKYSYDLYAPDGAPIALELRTTERVIGVEGSLFYSVSRAAEGNNRLRVWKLKSDVAQLTPSVRSAVT